MRQDISRFLSFAERKFCRVGSEDYRMNIFDAMALGMMLRLQKGKDKCPPVAGFNLLDDKHIFYNSRD